MFLFFNFDDLILFEISFFIMLFMSIVSLMYFLFGKQYKSLLYITGGNILYALLSLRVILTINGILPRGFVLVAFLDLTAMVLWMIGFLIMFRQKVPIYKAISIVVVNVVVVYVLSNFTNDFSIFRFFTTLLISVVIIYTVLRLVLDNKSQELSSFRYSVYVMVAFALFKVLLSIYRLKVFVAGYSWLTMESSINMMKFISLLFAIWINIVYVFLNNDLLLRKMKLLSHHDYLTKLPNRRLLIQKLEETHAMKERGITNYAVMILDIDNFKSVNDSHGHLVGDNVLIEFANLINSKIRKVDFFGRYGGEEFLLIVYENEVEVVKQLLNRLMLLVSEYKFTDANISLTFSGGVVMVDESLRVSNVDEVINQADKRLYIAKEKGKSRIVLED